MFKYFLSLNKFRYISICSGVKYPVIGAIGFEASSKKTIVGYP